MSQTETQAIAIEEELSQPCTIRKYPKDATGKDALIDEYLRALGVIGKCELQRKEALKATKKLKQIYSN